MDEITNNYIEETTCYLYSPKDKMLWEINSSVALYDVRLQIKAKNLSGYYVVFYNNGGDRVKVEINNDGRIKNWPRGFYDLLEEQLDQLTTWD